jgi:hypothetical protein
VTDARRTHRHDLVGEEGCSIEVPGDLVGLRRLREELRRVLAGRGDGMGDVVLVCHELVANSIRQTGDPVQVRVAVLGDAVRVEVRDTAATLPVAEILMGGGCDLVYWVLEDIAYQWGWVATAAGKLVWAELRC